MITLYRRNMSAQMLHTAFVTTLTQTRETMLDMQFEVTKQEIVIGYSFKKRCLEGTGYLSFGCWIANAFRKMGDNCRKSNETEYASD